MLRIPCPFCGPRDHAEFDYEGDATVAYPPLDAPADAWFDAVFLRENPRGPHREHWRHAQGCGSYLVVERDTLTHEIRGAALAHPGMAAALAARPEPVPAPKPAAAPQAAAPKTAIEAPTAPSATVQPSAAPETPATASAAPQPRAPAPAPAHGARKADKGRRGRKR